MDLKDLAQRVKNLEAARAAFDDLKTIPGFSFDLALCDKVVIDDGDRIIKIWPFFEGVKNLLIAKYFEKKGIPIFVVGKLIPECSTKYFLTTIEEKVSNPGWKNDRQVMDALLKSLSKDDYYFCVNFFDEHTVKWFGSNFNSGVDAEGNVKFFDYIANLCASQRDEGWALVDSKGRELYVLRELC